MENQPSGGVAANRAKKTPPKAGFIALKKSVDLHHAIHTAGHGWRFVLFLG